jgi:hypothetical protein
MSPRKPEACMTVFVGFLATLALAPVATAAENVPCHMSTGRPLECHGGSPLLEGGDLCYVKIRGRVRSAPVPPDTTERWYADFTVRTILEADEDRGTWS